MTTTITTIQSVQEMMEQSIWQWKTCSAKLNVLKRTTAFKWLTNNRSKSLDLTSQAEHFSYRRLVQGLSGSLSAFCSIIRECLDPVIETKQCAQKVDGIDIATNTPQQLIENLQAVFQCLRKAGPKLSMAKTILGTGSRFSWACINNQGSSPTETNDHQIFGKSRFPQTKNAHRRYIGFFDF